MSGGDNRYLLAKDILKAIEIDEGAFVKYQVILDRLGEIMFSDALVKKILNLLSKDTQKIIQKRGSKMREEFKIIEKNKEVIEEKLQELFSSNEDLAHDTQVHLDNYGFAELVKAVSKQINHENITIKEINEDRLWLSRYVDFLEEARAYISWQKSDQAIAKQKIINFKKQQKSQK